MWIYFPETPPYIFSIYIVNPLKGSEQQNVSVLATALTAVSLYASANYGNICHIFLVNSFFPAMVVVSVVFSLEGKQT